MKRVLSNLVYEYFADEKYKSTHEYRGMTDIYGNGHKILIKTLSNKILGKKDRSQKYLINAKDILPVVRFIEKLYGKT